MAERLRKRFMADTEMYNPALKEVDPHFGPIKGIEVGTLFDNRKECAAKGVHNKTFAGISGSAREGAYSIVLSGGYRDDKDGGDFFIYTGTGGQEDSFSGGGGPQIADQTFEHHDNAALLKSAETKRPVRVVRGANPKKSKDIKYSKYAPSKGFRYDGLYVVERAYMGKSEDGYQICQYELRRLPGQPPLPINTQDSA